VPKSLFCKSDVKQGPGGLERGKTDEVAAEMFPEPVCAGGKSQAFLWGLFKLPERYRAVTMT
jgi:hypothetical protein